jgi:hypothetical protein
VNIIQLLGCEVQTPAQARHTLGLRQAG